MRLTTNLQWPEDPFQIRERLFHPKRGRRIVAFDVEWTKNFRVRNGSCAFCYSLACVEFADVDAHDDGRWRLGLKSMYVDRKDEEADLLAAVASDMADAVEADCIIAGHQLSSDLSIIAARATDQAAGGPLRVARLWRERRGDSGVRVIDTRYDTSHLLKGTSRRLVDVCEELELDVTQPEIVGSMTAMHRKFLETGDEQIRERLIAMNLRHSLSTAIVAHTALGFREAKPLNVNRLLFECMWDQLEYLDTPAFHALAGVARESGTTLT